MWTEKSMYMYLNVLWKREHLNERYLLYTPYANTAVFDTTAVLDTIFFSLSSFAF